jgi:hypothetical protein
MTARFARFRDRRSATAHRLVVLAAATALLLSVGCAGSETAARAAATPARPGVRLDYDKADPRIAFAAEEIRAALQKTGHAVDAKGAAVRIVFSIQELGLGPQAFRIRREGPGAIRVVGGDSCGAMYGGLELAEQVTLGGGLDAVREMARKPYVFRRGLKFNIPFDARAPSYDDTGTAAQENVAVMWEWDFWQAFLDDLARHRYNVLTLWTNHPYPGLVELPDYPGVNYDDVCALKDPVTTGTDRHFRRPDPFDPANVCVVRKMTLREKIDFWTRVFDHAEARGIEIYMFHWNIYVFGAAGKHGITDQQDNPKTMAYMRTCIREFLKTYPQVDGIGVTAGERVNRRKKWPVGIEEWLWRTYGQGAMDAMKTDPDRTIRFIFRQHWADLGRITAAFKAYAGPFNTGHKYARARLYSTTTSPYLDIEYRGQLERHRVPCWLNLRNDDLFVHRWGDADYVREFLQNVPRDLMRYEAGFYMGPDGFVWGREFVSKDPALAGRLEIDKHWYRFMLWGRLAYDLTLTRDYFERRLAARFPEVEPARLYDTWAAASQIVPQVNRFFFRVNDFQFAPEGCITSGGFLTVEGFFKHPPLRTSGILSVQEYAKAVVKGEPADGLTPMEVADNLDRLAARTLAGVAGLRKSPGLGKELAATLTDMESMACLGRYYADKIRGAAALAVFRADPAREKARDRAVGYLENAVKEWEAYAKAATSQYRPQLLSRTHHLDWNALLAEVKKDVRIARHAKAK